MAALVAVMIMVSVGTFDWHSVQPATLRRMPKSETTVMAATVLVTVTTHNLAIGVVVGVLVAMTLFARRVAHLTETHRELVEDTDGNASAVYRVTGELFFASSNDLYTQFDYADDPDRSRHRPLAVPHLGRLHRGRPRRHHHQVRAQGQDRRHRRTQRAPARSDTGGSRAHCPHTDRRTPRPAKPSLSRAAPARRRARGTGAGGADYDRRRFGVPSGLSLRWASNSSRVKLRMGGAGSPRR